MFSTREVLGLLTEANPTERVDEERIRRAIRTGTVMAPSTVAGRYVWSKQDLVLLAQATRLQVPDLPGIGAAR